MTHEWTNDDAKTAHDRAVNELVAIMTSVAQGRQVHVDSATALDVRRRDAQMWEAAERSGGAS